MKANSTMDNDSPKPEKSESLSSYEKFTIDTPLAAFTTIFINIRSLILLPVLTRTLGTEIYGISSQILVILTLLPPLATMQLNQAMARFFPAEVDKKRISQGFSTIFFSVALVTVIFVLVVVFCALVLSVMIKPVLWSIATPSFYGT